MRYLASTIQDLDESSNQVVDACVGLYRPTGENIKDQFADKKEHHVRSPLHSSRQNETSIALVSR